MTSSSSCCYSVYDCKCRAQVGSASSNKKGEEKKKERIKILTTIRTMLKSMVWLILPASTIIVQRNDTRRRYDHVKRIYVKITVPNLIDHNI